MNRFTYLRIALLLFVVTSCTSSKQYTYSLTKNYQPDDRQLYEEIVRLDSSFFGAYNTCDTNLDVYANYFSEGIEFYHDKGGLMTSKSELIAATKKNVCGKVTRKLIKRSIEVYPIKDFGAIEIGLHQFHNSADPNAKPKVGRFTVIWKKENNTYKIVRVISLH